jgi:tight adherence protein B
MNLPINEIAALRAGGIAVAVSGVGTSAFLAFSNEKSLVNRLVARYLGRLADDLGAMFVFVDPRPILVLQLMGAYAALAIAVSQHMPEVALGCLPVFVLPATIIRHLRARRVVEIEQQADTFVIALASALRSTPSIGDAFRSLVPVVSEPLRSEIDLACKHMRVGCTLEEALLLLGRRVNSRAFDSALAVVLIAQRVGGNLPTILGTTGAAIRELNRLDQAARSRLASARLQLWIVAIAPFFFCGVIDMVAPGYFAPLGRHVAGTIAVGLAFLLWIGSLLAGRRIMKVSI